MTRILVLGTGTGIGKTHAGIALVSALASTGVSVAGLKPIESGVPASPDPTNPTDASALAAAGTFHVKPAPYALPDPVSPHLAARRAGIKLELERVVTWLDEHPARVLVIETAGAVLSPLGGGLTNLDLTRAARPDHVVLVAPDRLGVLHDVAATLHVLRTLGADLPSPTLILQPPAETDTSTGTNANELVLLGIAPRPHVFPRAAPTAKETRTAALRMLEALHVLP